MSVRKRKWRDKQGHEHQRWMIHIEHTWPDGRKQTIRKISPVQTKRGAEQYEREVRKALVSGQWEENANRQNIPTLSEFQDRFLAFQATRNKPTVMDVKRATLRNHLLPTFGRVRLDAIDEAAIDAFTVAQQAKALDPASINGHLKLLGRILRVARRWKLIGELPEIDLLKGRKPEFDFLTFDEAEQFLAAASQCAPTWHPYMVVAIRTGLRVGEMVALRWREDLDLQRGRLRVQRSHHRKHGFMTPKSDKARELPLTADARTALLDQQARAEGALVFPYPGRGPEAVLTTCACNHAIGRICEHAGLRSISNHVLRHTFASHAVMREVPLRTVQQWMGHSSIVVTERYAHLAPGYGDGLIDRLNRPAGGERPQPAGPQHMDSTRNPARPKSPPHTP